MTTCTKCLLDDAIPGVRVDEQWVCQYCRQAEGGQKRDDQRKVELKDTFLGLIQEQAGQGEYDCLVAFSGGKDSAYTLHLMREVYCMRPLAMTFDNWFQSEEAWPNIRRVLKSLNAEQVIVRPGFRDFQALVRVCLQPGLFPMKTMQRASAVCTVCLSMIRAAAFKLAIEKSIPFVVFGLSPGQAPLSTAVFKTNPGMIRKMQQSLVHVVHSDQAGILGRYLLQERHFANKDRFPYSINPLAFEHYDEQDMYAVLDGYGWKAPNDTDANSTNCLLNGLANEVHIQNYGFNPYLFELSTLVREGSLMREEALTRLRSSVNQETVEAVKQQIWSET